MAALPAPAPTTNLGFLTILREGNGYLGGYLVTNSWGRPLEFRLSTAVHPNRVQQILYGQSLEPYVCAELLGKTLVDKTATTAGIILTDHAAALDLRCAWKSPSAWSATTIPSSRCRLMRTLPATCPYLRELRDRLTHFDFAEPFVRIREAITEARRLGVAGRN